MGVITNTSDKLPACRTFCLWLFLLLGPAPAEARPADCLPVRVRNPEGNYIVPGVWGDIVYRRINGARLSLDAYVQKKGGRRPAVIVIHGGGWTAGSRIAYVGQFLEMLARAGYNWFSVDYRLGPLTRYSDALEDLRAALAFIRCHADTFRIAPDRIALLGEDGAREMLRRYSPLHHAHQDLPPLLLIHGTNERLWQQGVAMDKKLSEVGAPHELYAVAGAPHGMENWEGHPEWTGYQKKLVDWLRAHLRR